MNGNGNNGRGGRWGLGTAETKVVSCTFDGNAKRYNYLWDGEVQVGDKAVVKPSTEWKVVSVVGVKVYEGENLKWLHQVVDQSAERRLRTLKDEKVALTRQLDAMLAKAKRYDKYASIAGDSRSFGVGVTVEAQAAVKRLREVDDEIESIEGASSSDNDCSHFVIVSMEHMHRRR